MNHREYFNQLAVKWDGMTSQETRSRLPQIVKGWGIKADEDILDVGCGTGILLPLLCEATGSKSKIVLLDIAEEMLKRARNNGHPTNIHYIQADAAAIPIAGETFDFVICYSCFPHFPDKTRALAEMARVLRSNGRLVVCHTASRHEINELHKSIGDVIGNDTIPDEATMRGMLSNSGLKPVEIRDEASLYLAVATKN